MSADLVTRAQLKEYIRQAKESGWDAAVAAMTYTDGTPVEVADNNNPYRKG